MSEPVKQATDLGDTLRDTLGGITHLGLPPHAVAALCTIRIGVSSLVEAVTPGCGIGTSVRELIEELVLVAEVSDRKEEV